MVHVELGGGPSGTAWGSSVDSPLLAAHELVHGERGKMYGHPADDMGRTAALVNALLGNKLGAMLTAEDIATIMVCVKLSRQVNRPQADNIIDAAGYLECLAMIRQRRIGV
mgnify:CR=1 FL=1